jgi:trehalose 6-phosphate phosphatase
MSGRDRARALAQDVGLASRRPGAVRSLFLDLDGTLSPIAVTPAAARVPVRTLQALEKLVALGWAVTIVSGRPASDVRSMVPIPGARIFGSHGAEGPHDASLTPAPAPVFRRLAKLTLASADLAPAFPGALVEIKPFGVAFHDRAVAPDDLEAWRARVRELLDASDLEGLEVLHGRRVLEVRPSGYHKGRVVSAMLSSWPVDARDASLVAIGDDSTDEDLFRAVAGRGITIRVGPRGGATLATHELPSPEEVRIFLEALAAGCENDRTKSGSGRD